MRSDLFLITPAVSIAGIVATCVVSVFAGPLLIVAVAAASLLAIGLALVADRRRCSRGTS